MLTRWLLKWLDLFLVLHQVPSTEYLRVPTYLRTHTNRLDFGRRRMVELTRQEKKLP